MTTRIDDADPNAVWEPWVPQVGQKVRLRPNPECRCPTCGMPHARNSGGKSSNGEIARVVYIDSPDIQVPARCGHIGSPGHRIMIEMKGRLGYIAAAELAPLDASSGEILDPAGEG